MDTNTVKEAATKSAYLQWMVIQNCSSFLINRNKQTYSMGPNNLKACNSCYNGLIHHKLVGMEPVADGKGVVVIMKWRWGQQKLATSYVQTTINKNTWATLSSIQHMICKNKYYLDLYVVTICRVSTILGGQKPMMVKRKQVHLTKSS
ncbi:large ribosomal subunit protein eL28-like [Glossophaga mutica]